jgi:hypothetical protein
LSRDVITNSEERRQVHDDQSLWRRLVAEVASGGGVAVGNTEAKLRHR